MEIDISHINISLLQIILYDELKFINVIGRKVKRNSKIAAPN